MGHRRFSRALVRFLLRPDRWTFSGRSFILAEHLKKQGAWAVAMAALEERRRSWHPDVWHRHRLRAHKPTTNPLTHAYILQHQRTIHRQPRQSQTKGLLIFRKTIQKRLHCRPAKHAYIVQFLKKNSLIALHTAHPPLSSCAPLHPHIPAHTAQLSTSMVYMISPSKSRHGRETNQDHCRGLIKYHHVRKQHIMYHFLFGY